MTGIAVLPGPANALSADTATVVRPANDATAPGDALREGSATTAFSLRLPPGAACTGTSAEGGYRVQSFLVPATTQLEKLALGDETLPLYTVTGDPYRDAQTAQGRSNEPGYVVNVPAFNFALLRDADAPAGSYAMGLACTKAGAVDRLWSATVTLAADRSWRVATPAGEGAATSNSPAPSARGSQSDPARTASVSAQADHNPSVAPTRPGRNALAETPGGDPTVNVAAVEVPRRLLHRRTTAANVVALCAVLVVLRVAFLFRPRYRSLES